MAAVIFTHTHTDHWGGARGVLEEDMLASGRVPIIAPNLFMEHAVSENIIAFDNFEDKDGESLNYTYRLQRSLRSNFGVAWERAGFDVDSWAYHRFRSPFTDDRTRRNVLELAGWKIYQFTDNHSEDHILHVIAAVLDVFARSVVA